MMLRTAVLIALISIPVTFSVLFADDERIMAGFFRTDGILVPFAVYQDGGWSNPWPEPDKHLDQQIGSIAEIPKPWLGGMGNIQGPWSLTPKINGVGEVKVLKPAIFTTHCQSQWGLSTNFQPEPPPKTQTNVHFIVEKISVGFFPKQNIDKFVKVKRDSGEFSGLFPFIKELLQKTENIKIAGLAKKKGSLNGRLNYTGHPVSAEDRIKTSMSLKTIIKNESKIKGQNFYFFEATKAYPVAGSDGFRCNATTWLQGWFLKDKSGGFSLLDKNIYITDCDMKEYVSVSPFGLMYINDTPFVIVENNYYEAESYSILKIDKSEISTVLESSGGGC